MFDIIKFRKLLLKSHVRWKVESVDSIESTNSELNRRFCNSRDCPYQVLVADKQTVGHGRLNRKWLSVPGKDITASVIFPSPVPAPDIPKLSLCAGLALINVLRESYGVKGLIRWPNDILTENGKLAGILSSYLSTPKAVICGIGINVNSDPDELDVGPFGKRTTLLHEIGEATSLSNLLASWILAFEETWHLAAKKEHFELSEQFNSVSFYLGKKVKILPGAGNYREEDTELKPSGDEFEGIANGISESGALLVLTAPYIYYEVSVEDVIVPI